MLTLLVAAIAVPLNTVFGVGVAILLARHRFPGARLLDAVIDLPIAISPVVVGFSLLLVYDKTGWIGSWLAARGIQVAFSIPGIVLASAFISLPYVAREVLPVLQEIGTEQEQAAATLGAGPFMTLVRITLPSIRWGIAYGVTLTTARVLGEFGAVSVISGNISGQTETLTLYVGNQFGNYNLVGAYMGGLVLAVISLLVLGLLSLSKRKEDAVMAIQVRGVSKRFGDAVALEDVSLDVPTGSLTALLGPSGGGKSTLLRVVAGLEVPDSGRVLIDGEDVTGLAPRDRGIGFCFQHYAPFRHMNVWDNIAFGLKVRKRPKAEIRKRVSRVAGAREARGLCEALPVAAVGRPAPAHGAGRALAVEPRLLLLDEPFGALDAQVRKELRAWLRRLHDEVHITTVLVTHDQEEAMDVADRLAVIHLGHLEQVGTSAELYDYPVNDFVLTFVGPATSIGGRFVRPHDVAISRQPAPTGSYAAKIVRVTHLGFEVRVELELLAGPGVPEAPPAAAGRGAAAPGAWVQLDRDTARTLALKVGESVFLIPREVPGGLRPTGGPGDEPVGAAVGAATG